MTKVTYTKMVVVFKQKVDSEFWTNPTPEALIKECIDPYMRPCTDHATKTIRFTYEKENDSALMMKTDMWPTFGWQNRDPQRLRCYTISFAKRVYNLLPRRLTITDSLHFKVLFKMSEMILQATFAQKPRRQPDLLGDADRLQSACGKECQVDIIANNLQVTVSTDCKDKDVVMTGLTIKMQQENLFKDWELVPGWTWKREKKEHCCNIL
ncbi:hypothetical protein FPANT_13138 [Fusarium pseudoanthophilum]|uniref:Uncharacterized protein n=1 Tax=Fusarium pseudoanthophilum TaxID=48495 RepID=A0A8H5KDP3_9HYPO|nr:hypothetical protein FPANT_13138 [Fusarium pseudoanthophilum]